MDIGIVGLGRMGGNIGLRLMRAGHRCVAFDRSAEAVRHLAGAGATPAESLTALIHQLAPPRAIWVMLPAGRVTEETVAKLGGLLGRGDIVIDGGNSFWKDDVRRGRELAARGILYLDVGTSGGVWGLERGYCLMIGGDKAAVERLDPIFAALAPGLGDIPRTPGRAERDPRVERGYLHCGPAGSGHFVKMVHNGIEYGLMQAYAEGFDILRNRASEALPEEERFTLDTADIAELWRRGSVVSSWLLDLSAAALAEDADLSNFHGEVQDSGEGRWTVQAAIEEAVPALVLSASLYARFRSRSSNTFGEKLLSAMRFQFGGHVETTHGESKR
ncbi:decarboxylating 6-phosphogluconate dehydrogenase [Siccirubricoccus sp. KC 17139]|uniref:Decarboxylating 6-phosphogluconate dehydrogenase n=1 Tax=Siccirubricoccus soli TaxID=2899147 RepID=A0ABT1D811_9PROT|nr:decarboxylating 6-phosphogluconate dehydrogenase [Siccirubricoccus soli]MCO6417400.1 decarboxylating 6-phosphogluconate dehydrogenase [Siccirubricoccus soli]MCP2683535.1 decarboxylating 6-phosphogluconate dehydrogenase [Siccirubricoccus soli]